MPFISEAKREKAVKYAESHGMAAAARHFDVSAQSIKNWRDRIGHSGNGNGRAPESTADDSATLRADLEASTKRCEELQRENTALRSLVTDYIVREHIAKL